MRELSNEEYIQKFFPNNKGDYCLALLQRRENKTFFKHIFFPSALQAYEHGLYLDKQEQVVFLAQGCYSGGKRTKATALWLKAFFLDIDCGTDKPYKSRKEGVAALSKFVKETNLPRPSVIVSGNGLYAYWTLTESVTASVWEGVAQLFKKVVSGRDFRVDAALIANSAVVLRPIGTTHRKNPNNPKPVRLLTLSDDVKLGDFTRLVEKAAKELGISSTTSTAPNDFTADDVFQVYQEVPTSLELIRQKCAQVSHYAANRANVPEPLWRAVITIARRTTEGVEGLGSWEDDPTETLAKAAIVDKYDPGPATCDHLYSCNPEGCLGCKHKNKIKSPIVLGRDIREIEKAAPAPDDEEEIFVDAPQCFTRTEQGVFFTPPGNEDGLTEGVAIKFYDYDIYPVNLNYDVDAKQEMVTVRHHLPRTGWAEFRFRSALLCDSKQFQMTLKDNQVHCLGSKEKKIMEKFFEGYIKKIQAEKITRKLYNQLGWHPSGDDEDSPLGFAFGKQYITPEGEIERCGIGRNIPDFVKGYREKGDLDTWYKLVHKLNIGPTMPYLFIFFAGLGAPLMRFTGFDGAMVTVVGKTGAGKTLTEKLLQSAFGDHKLLMNTMKDTKNMLFSRLGVLKNLPMTIDEISNYEAMEVSDLVYQITQGREKGRLTEKSVEKGNHNTWQTVVVSSSNHSAAQKLSILKADSSAELMRMFEVQAGMGISTPLAREIAYGIEENFGVFAIPYLTFLVKKQSHHTKNLRKITEKLEKDTDAPGEERFWLALCATVLYAAELYNKLSPYKVSIEALYEWTLIAIGDMRAKRNSAVQDSHLLLNRFIDENVASRIIVEYSNTNKLIYTSPPRGQLVMRYELPEGKLFIDASSLRYWLHKKHVDYSYFVRTMIDENVFDLKTSRKSLGQGTVYAGGAVDCHVVYIDLKDELGKKLSDVSTIVDQTLDTKKVVRYTKRT